MDHDDQDLLYTEVTWKFDRGSSSTLVSRLSYPWITE